MTERPGVVEILHADHSHAEWIGGIVETHIKLTALLVAVLDREGIVDIANTISYMDDLAAETSNPAARSIYQAIGQHVVHRVAPDALPAGRN